MWSAVVLPRVSRSKSSLSFLGILYLYVKTIERAHTPAKMWEKIPLSKNYSKALEQVSQQLTTRHFIGSNRRGTTDRQGAHVLAEFYDPQMQTTCDKDHTVPHQNETYKTTTRVCFILFDLSILLWTSSSRRGRPKLIGVKKKLDRREATRERKALSAAHLEKSIEKELIERLKSKAYGDAPLNVNESVWQAILDREKGGKEKEMQGEDWGMVDDETDGEDEEEDELEGEFEGEFVSDISGDEVELSDLSDLEDIAVSSTAFIRFHP